MPNEIRVKSVLNKTKRRDPWFLDDYTLNPYSACSFNCLYCYIRGSKYGLNMEEKVSVKINSLEILERQLALKAKKQQYGFIVLSSATDPYLQLEEKYQLTREMLALIHRYKFPVHIITKSQMVTRDFDLLEKIDREAILPNDLQPLTDRGVFITFSFSTLDNDVGKIFEPGATPPQMRLETLRTTFNANFHCGVSLMPLLPFITDSEENLHHMFATFQESGAHYIFPASIMLFGDQPYDSKHLIMAAIKKHYPQLEEKYLKLFSFGQRPPLWYRDMLEKRIQKISSQYRLKNSLI